MNENEKNPSRYPAAGNHGEIQFNKDGLLWSDGKLAWTRAIPRLVVDGALYVKDNYGNKSTFAGANDPNLLQLDTVNDKIGIGTDNPASKLVIKGRSPEIGSVSFQGTGINDVTVSGVYTGTTRKTYTITISSKNGIIINFVDNGVGGTTCTAPNHGLSGGMVYIVTGFGYLGAYPIFNITQDTFDIPIPYIASGAGTWEQFPNTFDWTDGSTSQTGVPCGGIVVLSEGVETSWGGDPG